MPWLRRAPFKILLTSGQDRKPYWVPRVGPTTTVGEYLHLNRPRAGGHLPPRATPGWPSTSGFHGLFRYWFRSFIGKMSYNQQ